MLVARLRTRSPRIRPVKYCAALGPTSSGASMQDHVQADGPTADIAADRIGVLIAGIRPTARARAPRITTIGAALIPAVTRFTTHVVTIGFSHRQHACAACIQLGPVVVSDTTKRHTL